MQNYPYQNNGQFPLDPYTGMPINPNPPNPVNGGYGQMPTPMGPVYGAGYGPGYNADNVIRRTGRGRLRRNRMNRQHRRSSGNLKKAIFAMIVVVVVAFCVLYLLQNGFGVSITEIPRVDTE